MADTKRAHVVGDYVEGLTCVAGHIDSDYVGTQVPENH